MGIQRQRLRPVIWPLLNPDTGMLFLNRLSWRDVEREPGAYDWQGIEAAIQRARNIKRYALLRIDPDAPDWSCDPMVDFLKLLDALGAAFGREAALWGIDVVCPGGEQKQTPETLALVADSFCRNFPNARKFIRAGSRLEAALKDEPMLGIEVDKALAPADEARWPAVPLRMAVDPKDAAAGDWAIAHHISVFTTEDPACANAPTHAGYRFQVKTVEIDSRDQTRGCLTAQVTLANAGTLPCYTQGQFRLRLHGSGIEDTRAYDLPLRAEELRPGEERAVSQRLDITGLAGGEYDVHVGLFLAGTEYPVSFGIEGRISDGYYEGRLILEL